MSRTLNKVQLIGRLGADPEAHTTPNGHRVTSFSLATSRQWAGPDSTINVETDWHRVVAWGTLAETCSTHLRKGRLVYVEGRLAYRSWEADGQKHQRSEVVASDMLMLDAKPDEGSATPQRPLSRASNDRGQDAGSQEEIEAEEEMALHF